MSEENNTDTTDDTTTEVDTDDEEAQQLLADALTDASGSGTGSGDGDPKAELDRLGKELDKWRGLARKHESRSKENAAAAAKAKSAEERLTALEQQLAERDVASVERNGRLAMAQVHTKLASAGVKPEDVKGVLDRIDPTVLLKDGEPDDDAVTELATSLTKLTARPTPDHDQGRKGGATPPNMNDLIRRAAGIRTN